MAEASRSPKTGEPTRTVVLPAYNEEGSIAAMIAAVQHEIVDWKHATILVCDNASTDKTCDVVRGLQKEDKRIELLPAEENVLYAFNVGRGINHSTADRVFVLDGDGQYPPSVLHALDAKLDAGADLVLGHREVRVGGTVRVIASYIYLLLCRLYLGFDQRDINAGARALSRRLADIVDVKYKGSMVNPELYSIARSANMVIDEVSVGHEQRRAGATSHDFGRPFYQFSTAHAYLGFLRKTYSPLGRPRLTRRFRKRAY